MNANNQENRINNKTCACCGKELDKTCPVANKLRNDRNKWFYVCSWECLQKEHYANNYCNGSY
jgi:hypothetical protein